MIIDLRAGNTKEKIEYLEELRKMIVNSTDVRDREIFQESVTRVCRSIERDLGINAQHVSTGGLTIKVEIGLCDGLKNVQDIVSLFENLRATSRRGV